MQNTSINYSLYAITAPAANLTTQVQQAIDGGITMLQIREKNCTTKRLIELAYPILNLCRNAGIPCIIEILGDKAIIGTSAHNVAEAVAAEKAGATYLGCGAVFHTSTKHDATLLPYAVLCDIRKAVCIPVVAIGGITAHNIPQLYSSGIDGVAVVSAVFGQPDVTRAARELHELTNPFQKKEQRL